MEAKIEPWLLWAWNEQAFLFESPNYTLDDAKVVGFSDARKAY